MGRKKLKTSVPTFDVHFTLQSSLGNVLIHREQYRHYAKRVRQHYEKLLKYLKRRPRPLTKSQAVSLAKAKANRKELLDKDQIEALPTLPQLQLQILEDSKKLTRLCRCVSLVFLVFVEMALAKNSREEAIKFLGTFDEKALQHFYKILQEKAAGKMLGQYREKHTGFVEALDRVRAQLGITSQDLIMCSIEGISTMITWDAASYYVNLKVYLTYQLPLRLVPLFVAILKSKENSPFTNAQLRKKAAWTVYDQTFNHNETEEQDDEEAKKVGVWKQPRLDLTKLTQAERAAYDELLQESRSLFHSAFTINGKKASFPIAIKDLKAKFNTGDIFDFFYLLDRIKKRRLELGLSGFNLVPQTGYTPVPVVLCAQTLNLKPYYGPLGRDFEFFVQHGRFHLQRESEVYAHGPGARVATMLRATPVRAMLTIHKAVRKTDRNITITQDEETGDVNIPDEQEAKKKRKPSGKPPPNKRPRSSPPDHYTPSRPFGVHRMPRINGLPFPIEQAQFDGWDPGRENIGYVVDMSNRARQFRSRRYRRLSGFIRSQKELNGLKSKQVVRDGKKVTELENEIVSCKKERGLTAALAYVVSSLAVMDTLIDFYAHPVLLRHKFRHHIQSKNAVRQFIRDAILTIQPQERSRRIAEHRDSAILSQLKDEFPEVTAAGLNSAIRLPESPHHVSRHRRNTNRIVIAMGSANVNASHVKGHSKAPSKRFVKELGKEVMVILVPEGYSSATDSPTLNKVIHIKRTPSDSFSVRGVKQFMDEQAGHRVHIDRDRNAAINMRDLLLWWLLKNERHHKFRFDQQQPQQQ